MFFQPANWIQLDYELFNRIFLLMDFVDWDSCFVFNQMNPKDARLELCFMMVFVDFVFLNALPWLGCFGNLTVHPYSAVLLLRFLLMIKPLYFFSLLFSHFSVHPVNTQP